jgi:hypothetical protein
MMSPARKTTINELLNAGDLRAAPVDPEVCRGLLEQSRKHTLTARAGIDLGDFEGAFTLAYDACRKTSLALILAVGFRPTGESEHVTTFEAAAMIAERFENRAVVDEAADLRQIRHGAQYRGESIRGEDAAEAVEIAAELLDVLEPAVRKALAVAHG